MERTTKNKFKRLSAWIMTVMMMMTLVNVPAGTVEAASKKSVKSVKLNYTEYTLKKGSKVKLKATISPKNAKSKKVVWKSSKTSVATVNSKGVVKGIKNGKATITATVKETKKKATCKISVGTPVKKVTVNQSKITLKAGESANVKATVAPKNATNKKVTWTSSNTKVVTVSNSGKITALAEGSATVTVKAKDGSNKKAKISVVVQKAEKPVTKVNVTIDKNFIYVEGTAQASATVEPADASIKSVTWTSSDDAIAAVDAKGKITGKKPGKVTITATASNKVAGSKIIEVKPIPVSSVSLNEENKTIRINEKVTLEATVLPENAGNKKVTWTTSDDKIATVNEQGAICGVSAGETVITAITEDGEKKASCKVTVENIVLLTSFDELSEALKKDYEGIVLNSDEEKEFTIEEGDYSKVTLVVNTPNATITNEANFKSVEIHAISKNTWIEKAIGNLIKLMAEDSHVIVEGKDVQFEICEGADKVQLENNGNIASITLLTKVEMELFGTNLTTIPVKSEAEGSTIKTSIPLKIDADKTFVFMVKTGAETSIVAIANTDATPTIYGIGVITITDKSTNETKDIVAENGGEIEDTQSKKGQITGIVKDYNEESVKGAQVYVIPYTAAIEESEIDVAIALAKEQERSCETTTDDNGGYTIKDIAYGNYLMVVKAEGLQNYLQTVVVNQETVTSETITLVKDSETKGAVEGTIYDAFDASTVPAGITLILRKNHNNVSGMSVAKTTTNEKGAYKFENLLPGSYTIQVIDERTDIAEGKSPYIRMSFNTTVLEGTTVKEDMTISQNVDSQQIRFVLTWGKEKETVSSDLDSHLIGPSVDGNTKFHTYYSNESYYENGIKYADLDVDDTWYEGPETTTVYKAVTGEYHFYVYDYINQDKEENTILSTSEAVVKVYRGEQNVATYNVPNGVGTLWDVCTYNIATNTLTPVNKIYYHLGSCSNVGVDPVDIAKTRLKKFLDNYDGIDFGPELQEQVDSKMAMAKELYTTSTDAEAITKFIEENAEYFESLVSSTTIDAISFDGIKRYSITRRGCCYYDNEEEKNWTKEYSVITLQLADPLADIAEVKFILSDENATVQLTDSDKEEYSKLLTVTNSVTKAVEKYYILCKEFVPSLLPYGVRDGDNYLIDYYVDSMLTESEETIQYYCVKGENPTLENPEFSFEDEDIQATYEKASEGEKEFAGTLTVTYGSKTQIVPIKYIQSIRNIYIEEVKDTGNYIANWDYDWKYDSATDNEYKVYTIKGKKETFGSNPQMTFNVEPEKYEIKKEEGLFWNYVITVTYKGMTKELYVNYVIAEASDLLPTWGEIDQEDEWIEFDTISLTEKDGVEQVKVTGSKALSSWDGVYFGIRSGLTYIVQTEGDNATLEVYADEELIASYPLYYEVVFSIQQISDPGNYVEWNRSWKYDDEDNRYIVYQVQGYNEEFGTAPEITFSEEADRYEIIQEDGLFWNYVVRITYKEKIQDIYVKYTYSQDIDILPEEGYYPVEESTRYFSSIILEENDGVKQVKLKGRFRLDSWENIVFEEKSNLTYKVQLENETPILQIYLGESMIACYPLCYEPVIEIEDISDSGNYITWYWDYYENEDTYYTDYKVYCINGYNESLGENPNVTFGIDVDSYELIKEDGLYWNYVLRVTYKDVVKDFYVKYTQNENMDLLPMDGSVDSTETSFYFKSIQLVETTEGQKVELKGSKPLTSWENVSFSDRDNLIYKVEMEEEIPMLLVCLDEKEITRYPMYYYLDLTIVDITDSEDSIEWDYGWEWDGDAEYKVYYVDGSSESFQDAIVTFSTEVDKCEILEEEGSYWNYVIRATCQDKVYEYYVKYVQIGS